MNNIYIYILVMAGVSFAIRALPVTIFRRQIQSKFIKSFLYYVPYVTLAVMTFPAIIEATQSRISGTLALICGTLAAWFNMSMFKTAIICCAVVFVCELIII